jgi:Tol biopolymer transport system component
VDDDVEIYDLVRARSTPLTFDPMLDNFPIWTPDGDVIVFASTRHGGELNAYRKAADGSGDAEPIALHPGEFQIPAAASSDGSVLVTQTRSETGATGAIGAIQLDGDDSIEWLVASAAQEEFAALSPDGRWMAYVSDESGQLEVYVTPYPNVGDDTFRVSSTGGVHPFWGPDDHELFYATNRAVSGELVTIMAVEIESEPTFTPGTPCPVVEGRYRVNYSTVDTDGERFLMIKEVSEPSDTQSNPPQLIVVQNWFEELERLVPTP